MLNLNIIVAVATNNVIGRGDDLPWHLQDDLRRFKEVTMGQIVVMGGNTRRSIVNRIGGPLPGRQNIVLTRRIADTDSIIHEGFDFVGWPQTITKRAEREDVFVIGGASVYELFLPLAEKLYLTRVHADVEGDVFFPPWDEREWERIAHDPRTKSDRNEYDFTFEVYRRRH